MEDHLYLLKRIAQDQMPSGQIPTTLINDQSKLKLKVQTITPTYLTLLILSELLESVDDEKIYELAKDIIRKGCRFLNQMCFRDEVTGVLVWHFNAFYPPDWEDTVWCSYLLFKNGFLHKKELFPLKELIFKNETSEKGVGTWVKDAYSLENKEKNIFDPVVSLAISVFLKRVFNDRSVPTDAFLHKCIKERTPSYYYSDQFKDFIFSLLDLYKTELHKRPHDDRLFHHGRRDHIWYCSRSVWDAVEFRMLFN